MNLEQLIQQLDQDEQTEFETLVSESQAGGDSKAIRGRLAHLAIGVLKRLGQNPNPGPIIGQFNQLYAAASAPAPAKLDLPGLSAIDQYPYSFGHGLASGGSRIGALRPPASLL